MRFSITPSIIATTSKQQLNEWRGEYVVNKRNANARDNKQNAPVQKQHSVTRMLASWRYRRAKRPPRRR